MEKEFIFHKGMPLCQETEECIVKFDGLSMKNTGQ